MQIAKLTMFQCRSCISPLMVLLLLSNQRNRFYYSKKKQLNAKIITTRFLSDRGQTLKLHILFTFSNDGEGIKLLKKLSNINRPLKVGFKDMVKLMQQCEKVEKQHEMTKRKATSFAALYERNGNSNNEDNLENENSHIDGQEDENTRGILSNNPLSVFSGVFPGTKWCGTGDIARDFHDLGTEKMMDRCCRAHDICPVKIRAYQSRYNLTNNSLYTKSHCVCDDLLFGCLKASNTSSAQLMGNIYFNLVQMPCLGENEEGKLEYRRAREGF